MRRLILTWQWSIWLLELYRPPTWRGQLAQLREAWRRSRLYGAPGRRPARVSARPF